MSADKLDQLLSRDPFFPLRLHLSNGDTLDITNPGLTFLDPGALTLYRIDRPESRLIDDHHLIALNQIVRVEQIVTDSPSTSH